MKRMVSLLCLAFGFLSVSGCTSAKVTESQAGDNPAQLVPSGRSKR
ncbi:Prokaryotic membrane lipoprotein lipid attachment site profile [Acididesulfobacillus acetoxydans]|uniref:Prokaryotic membrane lipoprotein lipid attachment site profile n=1 Tax=Acididesulfobacillus acetoxydans TaxID=1561005 RepID=A0A8S0WGZ3_9FIRM|nr:hypothetical protein [Acididesulfobacillus acetoxydans]CAA7602322.1 Prokaryotic membrane lipoprotein lipid attachment site profile [Acididesulfobacillus acetoxydans]CEJ08443.1 Prokaryotic membrane lipoprotein lipid attachment site profile [Acididesulfobacillus acetoxydans]